MKWNEKNAGIYEIRNIINGKRYIGKTVALYRRKYQHFTQLKNGTHKNKHLQNAFTKYGVNSFIFNVIEECDEDIISEREYYWCVKYSVWNRDFGYNIELLSDDGTSIKSYESVKQLKESIKKSNHKKPKGSGNPTSKMVYQYDLCGNFIQSFESCHIAAEFYNKKELYTTISKVARNEYGSSLGYQWRYYKKETIGESTSRIKQLETNLKNNLKLSKPIVGINLNTLEETHYNSINDASKKLNINISNIARIVKGERKMSKKLNMTFKEKK